jgi:hypothetical protein
MTSDSAANSSPIWRKQSRHSQHWNRVEDRPPKREKRSHSPVKIFAELVSDELTHARQYHPHPINSFHEGYGVIYEELCEFWAEVMRKRAERDPAKLLAELVQVAAMCQRTAEDMGLIDSSHESQPETQTQTQDQPQLADDSQPISPSERPSDRTIRKVIDLL